jgi:hypothetical protein
MFLIFTLCISIVTKACSDGDGKAIAWQKLQAKVAAIKLSQGEASASPQFDLIIIDVAFLRFGASSDRTIGIVKSLITGQHYLLWQKVSQTPEADLIISPLLFAGSFARETDKNYLPFLRWCLARRQRIERRYAS